MWNGKKTILTIMLICVGFAELCSAGAAGGEAKVHIIHFPKDRSLGRIMVRDAGIKRQIQTFYHWVDGAAWHDQAEYLSEAQGDVIIPVGKRVGLFVNETAVKDLSGLSRLRPDDLYMLSLADKPASDKCMPHIAHLTGLKELDLKNSSISSKGMKHITKLQSLERLTLPKGTTNRSLSYVAKLKSLKGLYFYGKNRVTNAGLRLLSKLTSLKELTVFCDNAGLVHLAKLESLTFLHILGTKINDDGLVHIKRLAALKILNIDHHSFTDAGLAHLSELKRLENLELKGTKVTDEGLIHLKPIRTLKKLGLSGTQVTGNGLVHLAEIKSLEYLNLSVTQVTDNGLVHIKEMRSLEYLDLPIRGIITDRGMLHIAKLDGLKHLSVGSSTKSPLTDTSLKYVGQLDSLIELKIGGTGITDEGMSHLAKLTNLKKLTLFGCPITNEGLAKLRVLKSLESLWLYKPQNITLSGLRHLNTLRNLVELRVEGVKQDNTGLDISGLTKLEKLRLELKKTRKEKDSIYDSVRDEDLACLAKLKNLKWFQIGFAKHSMMTDAGIAHLTDLTRMERLTIGSPYLTDKTFSYLKNMKRLNFLRITGNITDEGLRYLEGLKALSYLRIYTANNFSPVALKQLKEKLPNLSSFTAEQDRDLKGMSKTKPNSSTNSTIAPPFAIKTLDGKDIKIEDYRGKVVILYFWATWCRPCVAGTPELKKFYADMKASFGEDFEMISFSMDNSEHLVREHIKKYELAWPQVRIGLHSKISSDYGVNDYAPKSFLIGPDGKILLTPESPQVDTKSFIEEVLINRKT